MEHSQRQHQAEENPLLVADGLQRTWDELAKDFVEDDDFSECLDIVIKIIARQGTVPPQNVAALITQLSAYSVKFRMMFTGHMSYLKGTDEANMKKNHYKELYHGLDNLVDALKYLVK